MGKKVEQFFLNVSRKVKKYFKEPSAEEPYRISHNGMDLIGRVVPKRNTNLHGLEWGIVYGDKPYGYIVLSVNSLHGYAPIYYTRDFKQFTTSGTSDHAFPLIPEGISLESGIDALVQIAAVANSSNRPPEWEKKRHKARPSHNDYLAVITNILHDERERIDAHLFIDGRGYP